MDVDERRRAGSAVEVLVAAADREVGVPLVEIDPHGTGRVAQVPRHQRAGGVCQRCHRRGVVHAPGAVVDVGQRDDGDVVGQRSRDVQRVAEADLQSAEPRGAGDDVRIGREVARLGHHDGTVRPQPGPRDNHLEQLNTGRVACHDAVGGRADETGDLGADPGRQADPVVGVPRRDQVASPLLVEDRRGSLPHADR